MRELLLTLLSLSLSGSLVALLLFAVRPFVRRRMSHSWQYYIWLLVLVRLLIPIGPEGNLMQTVGNFIAPSSAAYEVLEIEHVEQDSMSPDNMTRNHLPNENTQAGANNIPWPQAESQAPDSEQNSKPVYAIISDLLQRISLTAIGMIWLDVALALLLYKLLSYARLLREIKKTSDVCEDTAVIELTSSLCLELRINRQPEVYISNCVPSPMLAGTLRPFIALPEDCLNSAELRYILYHELIHYKRKDVLYKWITQVAICVHWFNPVLYIVRREIARDCELACDEAVIARVEDSEKTGYGEAILNAVKPGKAGPYSEISLSMGEDKRLLKERLDAIMKFKKKSKWVVFFSAILTAALLCGATYAGAYRAADSKTPAPFAIDGEVHLSLDTVTIVGKTWYLIDNEEQLRGLADNRYPMDGKYLLNGDITLDKAVDWVPIGTIDNPFTGVFNGNGYEITNLTITNQDVNVIGMFAFAESAEIYNVTLRNPDIESAFTPGNTIGPVLAFGRNCKSYDNQIIDPVTSSEPTDIIDNGGNDDFQFSINASNDSVALYGLYSPYGLTYQPESDKLLYNGQVVRYFIDRYHNGQGIRAMWAYDFDGTVDVYAIRNEVGLQGELTGLAAYDQEAFRLRTLEIQEQENNEPDYDLLTFRFRREDAPEHLSLWIQECENSPFDFQVTDRGGRFYVYVRGAGGADDFGFRGNVNDNNASMNMEISVIEGSQGDGYALFSIPLYSRFTVTYNGQMKSFSQ